MKKPKIDPNKIIRVEPRMVKEGVDVGPLFTMIIGFCVGMILLTLVSCEEQKPQKEISTELSKTTEDYSKQVIECTYEGCEYIKVNLGQSAWGSHKGNCKNLIHNNINQELRDSIKDLLSENKQLREENHILTSSLAQMDYDRHNK